MKTVARRGRGHRGFERDSHRATDRLAFMVDLADAYVETGAPAGFSIVWSRRQVNALRSAGNRSYVFAPLSNSLSPDRDQAI